MIHCGQTLTATGAKNTLAIAKYICAIELFLPGCAKL
jgi:hypothetical protein